MTLIELLENKDEALDAQEVAELLGVSQKKIYRLAASGVLPSFRIGKAIRFDAQDLAEWLRKKKHLDVQGDSESTAKDQRKVSTKRTGKMPPPDHVWRKKVSSLEAALGMDSLRNSSSEKAS